MVVVRIIETFIVQGMRHTHFVALVLGEGNCRSVGIQRAGQVAVAVRVLTSVEGHRDDVVIFRVPGSCVVASGRISTVLHCRHNIGVNDRRSSSCAVFAGIEAFGAQGVGNWKYPAGISVLTIEATATVSAIGQRADSIGDQSAVEFCVGAEAATASSASRKASGNSLPRFSARRRIPEQAFGLK